MGFSTVCVGLSCLWIWWDTLCFKLCTVEIRELKKNSRGRWRWKTVKIFRHNPCVFLSMFLLWFHCLFLFLLKFNCLQRVFLNEKIDDNCWNIDHVLQTWKWSNWRLTREQDGTNVSLISHIHMRFLSCVISFIVLLMLPSLSSTVFLSSSYMHRVVNGRTFSAVQMNITTFFGEFLLLLGMYDIPKCEI